MKTRESLNEEKVVGFRSACVFPVRKRKAVTKGRNHKDKPPIEEYNPGSRYRQRLERQPSPLTHSRYIHIKQEHGPPDPPTIEPGLLIL